MSDPFDLERFVSAQAAVYPSVLAELRDGQKRSHWMWFVFPQLKGLSLSQTATHFGIGSRAEAAAYLAHPVLGPRLLECTLAALGVPNKTAFELFGDPDCLKFCSSMTLFAELVPEASAFRAALARFFEGEPDERTLALLA